MWCHEQTIVTENGTRCGIQNINIVETSEEGLVKDKEFPWVVSLQDSQYTHLAFGSILRNHMTVSILRKISVKDIELCPLNKIQKTGCGNHVEQETDSVCLGDPGNPMMCQLKELNLWMLKGILSHGSEQCPGLFLYINVEDYSDWITSKTKRTSPPLSPFRHWENLIPFPGYSSRAAVTQKTHPGLGQVGWSRVHLQGQKRATMHSWLVNGTQASLDFRERGPTELGTSSEMAVQPVFYDYYGGGTGEVGESESTSV
ncbi:hypothetical protein CB1_000445002 [Camelus ferus]|nr:hypothetical protein CB1_000445002 [Camelus ferus]